MKPPAITVQLAHIKGPLQGIQEFADDVITIGRHPSCSVRFPADLVSVSRKHAEIIREGNVFKLVDHSTNGTLVNNKPVKDPVVLKSGDMLEFSPGGPKASFITTIVEREAEAEPAPPRREEPQPVRPIPEQPPRQPRPPTAATPQAPVMEKPPAPEPYPEPPVGGAVQKIAMPLIIQFGPTIRSFKELPVTIGRGKNCDFSIDLPAIAELHAQILFIRGQYCIKDLTGQDSIRVNGRSIRLTAPLQPNDRLSLAPQGPVFEFLGEGRLAEVTEPSPEEAHRDAGQPARKDEVAAEKHSGGIWSILKKNI